MMLFYDRSCPASVSGSSKPFVSRNASTVDLIFLIATLLACAESSRETVALDESAAWAIPKIYAVNYPLAYFLARSRAWLPRDLQYFGASDDFYPNVTIWRFDSGSNASRSSKALERHRQSGFSSDFFMLFNDFQLRLKPLLPQYRGFQ